MALLQAALNGDHGRSVHPAVPVTVAELVGDARACVGAGAGALHLHPRGGDERETLEARVVDEVVERVRAAVGVSVGVSTGAWIEPDLERRMALISGWAAPDYASVNLSEEGHAEVMRALLERDIGIEAGVWTPEDAERLARTGLADRVLRVLVESNDPAPVHAALDAAHITAPRLQHGDDDGAWPVLQDAIARGLDTRIGLEDAFRLPDGTIAAGNAAMIAAARALGA